MSASTCLEPLDDASNEHFVIQSQPTTGLLSDKPIEATPRFVPGEGVRGSDAPLQGRTPAELLLPVVVLKESALAHNTQVMASYCRDNQIALAPHVKTHMSPELANLQLAAGAWGLTVANVSQARVFRSFGALRLLIANEIIDAQSLGWIAGELNAHAEVELSCLVDSLSGVRLMQAALSSADLRRPLSVLLELGFPGGRTGCRSVGEALDLANAIREAQTLQLVGVECYEGLLGTEPDKKTMGSVDALLGQLSSLVTALDAQGAWACLDEVLFSAGGSAFFDRVVPYARQAECCRPVRAVLRCGSYLTHDHGSYRRTSPFGTRLKEYPPLQPAAELWARATSAPEPGLAILAFGKRDCPYDLALPVPLSCTKQDGSRQDLTSGATVFAMNDQHAYVRTDRDDLLEPGDIVRLGMSHPCTIFDKWHSLPIVDDHFRVKRLINTYF